MKTTKRLTSLIALLFLFAVPLGAATLIVPDDHSTIQGAIAAAATGDVIRVRPGTYTENIDFLGKQITVISFQGPVTAIIDADFLGPAVTFAAGEGPGSTLQGFTLTNGTGFFDSVELRTFGGGIFCDQTSPVITNCRVESNSADIGGGICCESASPEISGCVIQGNTADNGAGIFIRDADPRVSDCTINANIALYVGGGIQCVEAAPIITGCSIGQNETTSAGVGGGGGISAIDSSPVVTDNSFRGNQTPMSGGAFHSSSGSEPVVSGNLFKDNSAQNGAAICCEDSGTVLLAGNRFTANLASELGGGIYTVGSRTVVTDNTFISNDANDFGGGLYYACPLLPGSYADIRRNIFENNHGFRGGGLYVTGGELRLSGCRFNGNSGFLGAGVMIEEIDGGLITGNVIHENEATRGGGILIEIGGTLALEGNTFNANDADYGGAVYCGDGTILTVAHSIFWGDTSPDGKEIYLDYDSKGLSLDIDFSDVDGGIGSLVVETGCILNWGEGMIDADPLFTSGPVGDFYLSQTAAGQAENSPCVDAGDPAAGGVSGTTRIDGFGDAGVADLGLHQQGGRLAVGPGPGETNPPVVRLFPLQQDAAHDLEFPAYGADSYGVNVHTGDLDGDGTDEIITGAGPGEVYGPHVRGFTAAGQAVPGVSFLAYGTNKYGVNVAAGDIDADGRDEIITGAGPGAVFGPHVRGWNVDGGSATAIPGVSYFAYGTLKYGVNVACGDIDGDGFAEIVTGAGPGTVFGPHVRGWNVDNAGVEPIPAVSYFAYGTLQYGVRVACGDIDGDGIDEIITAPGPSATFGPHIRGWNYDGSAVTAMPNCSFFALLQSAYTHGAQLFSGVDLDGDGRDEMVVGAGPSAGAPSRVAVFRYSDTATSQWFYLRRAMPEDWRYGATVAAGNF